MLPRLLTVGICVAISIPAQSNTLEVSPYCGTPLVGWSEYAALSSPLTATYTAQVPSGSLGAFVIDLALPCSGTGFAGTGNFILLDWIPGGANYQFSVSVPPFLRNIAFVGQFVDVTGSSPVFGEANSLALDGPAVLRGDAVPSLASFTERDYYGETFTPWQPFDTSSGRYQRLTQLTTIPGFLKIAAGASAPGEQPWVAPSVAARLNTLATLVQLRYGHLGWHLRVTSAKRDPNWGTTFYSFHKVGRGVDLTLADANGNKLAFLSNGQAMHLAELTRLAVDAGLDIAYHEPGGSTCGVPCDHLHASAHTGGPTISSVSATPGWLIPATTNVSWTVTATVIDHEGDGVLQLFAGVTQPGVAPVASDPLWTAAAKCVDFELLEINGAPAPVAPLPNQSTVTFEVTAPASVLIAGQADLHIWARDTFGSVELNWANPAPRSPVTKVEPVVGATALVWTSDDPAVWQGTSSQPAAGWNTNPSYNTASWSPLLDVIGGWGAGHVTAPADDVWVGQGGCQPAQGNTTVWMRGTFDVLNPVSDARLSAGVDDDMEIWINGTLVVSESNGVVTRIYDVDVTNHLVLGTNLIAIRAVDTGGCRSFWLSLLGTN